VVPRLQREGANQPVVMGENTTRTSGAGPSGRSRTPALGADRDSTSGKGGCERGRPIRSAARWRPAAADKPPGGLVRPRAARAATRPGRTRSARSGRWDGRVSSCGHGLDGRTTPAWGRSEGRHARERVRVTAPAAAGVRHRAGELVVDQGLAVRNAGRTSVAAPGELETATWSRLGWRSAAADHRQASPARPDAAVKSFRGR